MFLTRQTIMSAAPEVVITESKEDWYMVKEALSGFSIPHEVFDVVKARFKLEHPVRAVWVGEHEPPEDQCRYEWVLRWRGGAECKI